MLQLMTADGATLDDELISFESADPVPTVAMKDLRVPSTNRLVVDLNLTIASSTNPNRVRSQAD
jgi:hypothetical protein